MMLRFEQAYRKLTISKLQKYTGAFVSILEVGRLLQKMCLYMSLSTQWFDFMNSVPAHIFEIE